MLRTKLAAGLALAGAVALAQPTAVRAQGTGVVGYSTSVSPRGAATVTFDVAGGESFNLTLRRGGMLLNDQEIARYRETGPLEPAWRDLLASLQGKNAAEALTAISSFAPADLSGGELAGLEAFHTTAAGLKAAATVVLPVTIDKEAIRQQVRAAVQGAAEASAEVARAMADVARNTPAEVAPVPQVPAPPGVPRANGVGISSVVTGLTNLAGLFIALTFMGVGMLFFAPRQLEAVSDQVFRSFWRSFLAGLFAQPLIVPALGMLVVGLTLTVVGVLVVPFAILAYAVALVLAVAGGFIAVSRAIGEIYLRRKEGGTPHGTWTPVKYMVYGLIALLAIWLPSVLFSWIPVVGTTLAVVAGLLTWFVATAGFGATLISRAGIRGTVVRRIDAALTDEHYWNDVASLSTRGAGSSVAS